MYDIFVSLLVIVTAYLYYIAFNKNTYGSKSFISLLIIIPLAIFIFFIYFVIYCQKNNLMFPFKETTTPIISIISLLITSTIAYVTIVFNKNKSEVDLVINMIKFQNELMDDNTKDNVENVLTRLREEMNDSNVMFIRTLNQLKKLTMDNNIDNYKERDLELQLIKYIENNKKQFIEKYKINYNNISERYKKKISGKKIIIDDEINKLIEGQSFNEIYNNSIDILKTTLQYNEVIPIINDIFEVHYPDLGHFFKHFHRIIRLLLQGNFRKNIKLRQEIIGILRSQFSEDFLLVIYYNATFTKRGIGLGFILQGLSFFGDSLDFSKNAKFDQQHISNSSLLFEKKDRSIMESIYSQKKVVSVYDKNNLSKFEHEIEIFFNNN